MQDISVYRRNSRRVVDTLPAVPRQARDARILAAVQRLLEDDEMVSQRGICWAATQRPNVPLLVLGRHQYDVVLTDRRVLLFARRRRHRLRADEVAMAKRLSALNLEATRNRAALLQHRVRTDSGSQLVLEWRLRHRALGRAFAAELTPA
jgi:hypothetical protein